MHRGDWRRNGDSDGHGYRSNAHRDRNCFRDGDSDGDRDCNAYRYCDGDCHAHCDGNFDVDCDCNGDSDCNFDGNLHRHDDRDLQ